MIVTKEKQPIIENLLNEESLADAAEKEIQREKEAAEKALEEPITVKIDNEEDLGDIGEVLDNILKANLRLRRHGEPKYLNVLFVGGAGTGKTERIEKWAKRNNINLVKKSASSMDEGDIGGALAPDMAAKKAFKLGTVEFDELADTPRSVLFLDEWNRGASTVRGTLLTLIQNHVIPDASVKGGVKYLPNFLFTIAAINPSTKDYNVDELDIAENSRMRLYQLRTDIPQFRRYLLKYLDNLITETKAEHAAGNITAEEANEDLKVFSGNRAIADKVLSDPSFTFTPPESDTNRITINRTFENLINNCDGTKDNFLELWSQYCDPSQYTTIETILQDYQDIDDKANAVFDDESQSDMLQGFSKAESPADRAKRVRASIGI